MKIRLDDDHRELIIVSALLLATLSFLIDDVVSSLIRTLESPILDGMMWFLSSRAVIAVFFILSSIMMFKKTRHFITLWASLLMTAVIVTALKLTVERARPEDLKLFLFGLPDYSFPSMHTALMFAAVYILWKTFEKERYIFVIYASMVGLSRIYLVAHHFSDVIFGAIIGSLISHYTYRMEEHYRFSAKIYKKRTKEKIR